MRSDAESALPDRDSETMRAAAWEPHDPGSANQLVSNGIETARKAYERWAVAAEFTVNACAASAARNASGLRSVAGETRQTLQHVSEAGLGAARDLRDRVREVGACSVDAMEATAARGRVGLRGIALRGLVDTDTNVRAGFDCVEKLARVASLRDFFAVQARFALDQSQRSMRQALDVQRLTIDLMRAVLHAG